MLRCEQSLPKSAASRLRARLPSSVGSSPRKPRSGARWSSSPGSSRSDPQAAAETLPLLHHRHVGFDRVGNETILVSGVVHFIKLLRIWYAIAAPRDLRV